MMPVTQAMNSTIGLFHRLLHLDVLNLQTHDPHIPFIPLLNPFLFFFQKFLVKFLHVAFVCIGLAGLISLFSPDLLVDKLVTAGLVGKGRLFFESGNNFLGNLTFVTKPFDFAEDHHAVWIEKELVSHASFDIGLQEGTKKA